MSDIGVCSVQEFFIACAFCDCIIFLHQTVVARVHLAKNVYSPCFQMHPVLTKSPLWSVEQILQQNLAALLVANVLLVACSVGKFFW